MKILSLLLLSLLGLRTWSADCGIAPGGSSFGPNCEILRDPPLPPKHQIEAATPGLNDKKLWQLIQLGAYSGKPGYYVNIGTTFQTHLEAVVMNEKVMLKAQQEFSATAKLGAVKTCQAIGIQQAIGFSLFDLQNCK